MMTVRFSVPEVLARLTACVSLVFVLSSCSNGSLQQMLAGPALEISYDDLGPEAMVSPLLGPRGTDTRVMIHSGGTQTDTRPRRLNAYKGLLILRHNERHLPRTLENEALRERLKKTYGRLYDYYRTRREASLGAPPMVGRGAMSRMHMTPAVPPYL